MPCEGVPETNARQSSTAVFTLRNRCPVWSRLDPNVQVLFRFSPMPPASHVSDQLLHTSHVTVIRICMGEWRQYTASNQHMRH